MAGHTSYPVITQFPKTKAFNLKQNRPGKVPNVETIMGGGKVPK